jgi:hypothetical protein
MQHDGSVVSSNSQGTDFLLACHFPGCLKCWGDEAGCFTNLGPEAGRKPPRRSRLHPQPHVPCLSKHPSRQDEEWAREDKALPAGTQQMWSSNSVLCPSSLQVLSGLRDSGPQLPHGATSGKCRSPEHQSSLCQGLLHSLG